MFELPTGSIADKKLKDLSAQDSKNAIVPPGTEELVKSAKIKDSDMELMQRLIADDISPLTDPKKFLSAFGATAEQAGISRTWGPLDSIRELVSPDYQNLKTRQHGLMQLGSMIHGEMAKQFINKMNAPRTLREAQQALPGVIQPVESQRGASLDQIVGQGMQGPTQAVDPNSQLTPFQSQLAGTTLSSLGEGKMMRTDEGIVPSGFATVQGRRVSPAEFDFAQRAALAPANTEIQPPSGSLPQPLVNKILEERGQAGRQMMKGPDLNNRLESLAAVESVKKYGISMPFTQIAARDPVFAEQLRQQAEIQEAKDIFAFQQGEMMKRAIAQTGPVTEEKSKAERRQPVGGEVAKYARLGKNGVIERPSDGMLSQDDLNAGGYIDVSRSQDEIEGLNSLAVIRKDFTKLKGYADELFTAGGGLGAKINQAGKLVIGRLTNGGALTKIPKEGGGFLTRGELANVYQNEVEAMLEYYGRHLKGMRGAATEPDVQRMRKNFAGDWTSKAVKDKLMDDTLNFITNIETKAKTSIFGEKAVKQSQSTTSPQAKTEEEVRARIRQLHYEGKTEDEIAAILRK